MLGNRFVPTLRFVMAPDDEGGAARKAPRSRAAASDSSAAAGAQESPQTEGQGGAADSASRQETSQGAAQETVENSSAGQTANDAARLSQNAASSSEPFPDTFPENWRHDMAAGDKAFLKTLDRFDSPAALAKAYKELTARLSSGDLKAAKPLGDNATPEQVAAWRADHGLPENAATYVSGLKLADGVVTGEGDQPLLASFAEQAMKANWTSEQFNQAVGWYFAMQDRLLARRQFTDAEFKEKASHDLMREWGNDYTINRNTVVQFFDRNFPQQFRIDLLNARLPDGRVLANDPAFSKAILEVAKSINPAGAVLPNASGAGLSNVESRIAEIEGKYMRATHGSDPWKTYWSGESGARMQQEYRGLLAAREQARRGRAG
jgi:hypothetical protein